MSSNNIHRALALGLGLMLAGAQAFAASTAPSAQHPGQKAGVDHAASGVVSGQTAVVITPDQDKTLAKSQAPVAFSDAPEGSASREITRIQTETAILQAQAARAKASADLQAILHPKSAEKTAGSLAPTIVPTTAADKAAAAGKVKTEPVALPSLVAIYGRTGGAYYATLKLPSGSMQDVRAGDAVEGGVKIESISDSRVTLRAGEDRYTLRGLGGK